ncbi:hypothetical protein GQ602_003594 [Ophiocordyceps camponoti-floridani]|uniref:Uncharacterized protein n=1 Tax=Ophiocordyceps camponoti-floridani TaxID=2030778 RepID=A0A8H4Q8J3_9HYPO|nr:hypothetical protein GQ602_003594 [Ophiocordyceps camponoti-floridani]
MGRYWGIGCRFDLVVWVEVEPKLEDDPGVEGPFNLNQVNREVRIEIAHASAVPSLFNINRHVRLHNL